MNSIVTRSCITWLRGELAAVAVHIGQSNTPTGVRLRNDHPVTGHPTMCATALWVGDGQALVSIHGGPLMHCQVIVFDDPDWFAVAARRGLRTIWATRWPTHEPPRRMLDNVLTHPASRWEHIPPDRLTGFPHPSRILAAG